MRTGRAAVEAIVERDAFLQDVLARGVVNASALAEWLVEHRELEAGPETVAHHVREIQEEAGGSRLQQARSTLASCEVLSTSGRALLTVARTSDVQKRLARLLSSLEVAEGTDVWFATGKSRVVLAIDEVDVAEARKVLGSAVEDTRAGLTELRLSPEGSDGRVAVLGAMVSSLEAADVEVVHAVAAPAGPSVLVPTRNRVQAVGILKDVGPT